MKFKILTPLAAIAIMAMTATSCGKKQADSQLAREAAVNAATREELAEAVNQRDELLALVAEINGDMTRIQEVEGLMSNSVYMNGDMPTNKEQLRADLASIQRTLQERRERLAELEEQLKCSNLSNSNLTTTITSLRQQIDAKDSEITRLNTELSDAKVQITQLNTRVDSLSSTVASTTDSLKEAERMSTQLTNELNTCYYAIGSKKELKENKIIETGFLRKTKIMKGDFDKDFFTEADKRQLTKLPLHTKKEPKILTNQPSGSYTLQSENGQYVLTITNPAEFWSLSNYLVIQIN